MNSTARMCFLGDGLKCFEERICDHPNSGVACEAPMNVKPGRLQPGHDNLGRAAAEAGGFKIRINSRLASKLPPLTELIPRLQPDRRITRPLRYRSTFAVPLDRVGPSGHSVKSAAEMLSNLHLPPETELIVASWQNDGILERLWANRNLFVDKISRAGYALVTVPNFSPYTDDAFVQRRYAINRSNRFYDLLANAGVATIPQVSWAADIDIIDWIDELRQHPEIRSFSVDFQTLHQGGRWHNLALNPLKVLLDGIGPGYEIVVNGVSSERHIRDLLDLPAHFHLVSAWPFSIALSQTVAPIPRFERECRMLRRIVHAQRSRCQLRRAPTPARPRA